MKNRIASMPLSSMPQDMRLLARNILVFFDDKQQNSTLKRIAKKKEKDNKALVIDNMEQIGIIDVMGNQDGYGNILWAPKDRIGLLRRLSSEKLIESEPRITDRKIIDTISTICRAEKSGNNSDFVIVADVLALARMYIERYPLLTSAQAGNNI
ncbi:MAG: hypothetical protein LBB36_02995 [Fibromonadaceae bacterium]|jgi:hypothetical protein|nr:hypothetical protein [Fibromonadaceae bacterium]